MASKFQQIGEMNEITSKMKPHLEKLHKMLDATENRNDLPEDASEMRRLAMRAREYHRQVNRQMTGLVNQEPRTPDGWQQNSEVSMEAQVRFEADVAAAWLLFKKWKPELAQ